MQIASHGYANGHDVAFSPLLPLGMRALSWLTGSLVLAGILISLGACLAAFELVRRLTELEFGAATAKRTVQLLALGPLSVFLSAVYTDGLFVALSAGTFYAARRGRWWLAATLGACGALARPAGVLLLVPVLVLFFYGPREDATPRDPTAWWHPRYGISRPLTSVALMPLAAGLFSGYLAFRGFGVAATADAQRQYMHHRFAFPWVTVWQGLQAAWHQLVLAARANTSLANAQSLIQALALPAIAVALLGTFRRLPKAYGIYVSLALLVHLCSPSAGDPLKGLDRYASLRFPLFMWAASWSLERGSSRQLLFASAALMVLFTAQFSTWHVVSSLTL